MRFITNAFILPDDRDGAFNGVVNSLVLIMICLQKFPIFQLTYLDCNVYSDHSSQPEPINDGTGLMDFEASGAAQYLVSHIHQKVLGVFLEYSPRDEVWDIELPRRFEGIDD